MTNLQQLTLTHATANHVTLGIWAREVNNQMLVKTRNTAWIHYADNPHK